MDKILDKFGLFDYINVFFAGTIFFMGMCLLGFDAYTDWFGAAVPSEPTFLEIVCIIAVYYTTGIILQTIGGWLEIVLGYRDTAMKTFLWTEEEREREAGLGKEKPLRTAFYRIGRRRFPWFRMYEVIDNKEKLNRYRKLANDLLDQRGNQKEKRFSKDQCSYFLAYCEYYNQVRNKSAKTEKMRELRGLSSILTGTFLVLALVGAIRCICGCVGSSLEWTITFTVLTIISAINLKRNMAFWVRMVLGVYEANLDYEKSVKTRSNDN